MQPSSIQTINIALSDLSSNTTSTATLVSSQQVTSTVVLTGPKGADGAQGIQGVKGDTGTAGVGVPTGGTTGQVLTKSSNTDYATTWSTPAGVGGGTGDMTKAVYDTNNDGIVDNSTNFNGQAPSYYLNRTNHTGTQTSSTISDFSSAASAAAPVQSVAGKTGTVSLVKGDVGLANVDNTSDINKPISTATQTALNGKVNELPDSTVSTAGTLVAGVTSNVTVSGTYTAPTPDASVGTPPKRFAILNMTSPGVNVTLSFPNPAGTTVNLTVLPGEVITFRQKTTSGYANESGNKPLSQLDARYQALLVSGTNIKTINGNSLLGSGDLTISGGGSGAAITRTITQTAHGFTVGKLIYHNGTNYVVSSNASTSTAEVDGIVSSVTDANTFVLTMRGYITGLSGLTANTTYFLDTSGNYTATAPTTVGVVRKPLFHSDSTTSAYFNNYLGIAVAAPSGGSGITRLSQTISAATTGGSTASVDYVYIWNGSTVYPYTQPTAASNNNRYTLINASTVNQTVTGTSGQTFNGNTTMIISPNSVRELLTDGTNWRVL